MSVTNTIAYASLSSAGLPRALLAFLAAWPFLVAVFVLERGFVFVGIGESSGSRVVVWRLRGAGVYAASRALDGFSAERRRAGVPRGRALLDADLGRLAEHDLARLQRERLQGERAAHR